MDKYLEKIKKVYYVDFKKKKFKMII